MNKPIHIALISTWFPPIQGVAINRIKAFTEYLDPERFRISVLTLAAKEAQENEQYSNITVYRFKNFQLIPAFANLPDDSTFIHKIKVGWNIIRNLLLKYPYQNWEKKVTESLIKLNRKLPVDVVISSYAPVEAHLAAAKFCLQNPDIFWIADMRDEMAGNPEISFNNRQILEKAERIIETRANLITAVSRPILNDFQKRMPQVPMFAEIRNGYCHSVTPKTNFNDVFTIVYAGTFYGKSKPFTFFEGLTQFLQKKHVPIRIRFIGTHHNFDIPELLKGFCSFLPAIPHEEAVTEMANADANLLILPATKRKGVYSGKLFDYLSVKKPIIAVINTKDSAAELITECQAGFIAGFNDIDGIESAIASAYLLWEQKGIMQYNDEQIKQLHRRFQVENLQKIILKWKENSE